MKLALRCIARAGFKSAGEAMPPSPLARAVRGSPELDRFPRSSQASKPSSIAEAITLEGKDATGPSAMSRQRVETISVQPRSADMALRPPSSPGSNLVQNSWVAQPDLEGAAATHDDTEPERNVEAGDLVAELFSSAK